MINFNWILFGYLRIEPARWLLVMITTLLLAACSGGTSEVALPSPAINEYSSATSMPSNDANSADSVPLSTSTSTKEPTASPTVTQSPVEEATEVLETPEFGLDKMIREAREKLIGGTWVLSAFSRLGPDAQDDLSEYTLTFNEDGTFNFTANCVRSGGSFSTDSPYTLSLDMESPLEDDRSDLLFYQLLNALMQVERKTFSENDQILDLRGIQGTLTFERGETELATPVLASREVGIEPGQIALDTQGLFSSWTAYKEPATSNESGMTGLPEHIVITFDGADPANRQSDDTILYIIPVTAYKEMWEATGVSCITNTLDELFAWLSGEGAYHFANGMTLLPFEEITGINSFTDTGEPVWLNGYSVVKPSAITGTSRYIYNGLSDDGQYFIAFFTPAIGENFRSQTADKMAQLIGSLTIDGISGPNYSPVVDKLWQLERVVYSDGAVTEASDLGTFTFQVNSDDTFYFTAECNTGSGDLFYPQLDAVAGGFATSNTLTTLGDCEQTSLSQQFMNLFGDRSASSYLMEEGYMVLYDGETLPRSDSLFYFTDVGDVP